MSKLVVLPEDDPTTTERVETELEGIAEVLAGIGVRFERWSTDIELAAEAGQDEVLAAYAEHVARIMAEGYITVDVVRLAGDLDDPAFLEQAAGARQKFLAEHTHADDEVRFFVEGRGAFYLRAAGKVHIVLCEAGDYISVPKDTRHWFDMGTRPHFCAIRFFEVPDGWVGDFTGDPIASSFPSFDELVAHAG